jgi:hypothetical protein
MGQADLLPRRNEMQGTHKEKFPVLFVTMHIRSYKDPTTYCKHFECV